jgi:hypothetical protein
LKDLKDKEQAPSEGKDETAIPGRQAAWCAAHLAQVVIMDPDNASAWKQLSETGDAGDEGPISDADASWAESRRRLLLAGLTRKRKGD